ncbi:MAG: hypothetical protein M1833_006026 [Piccolia ochrophora]|nr:MAG: hypothetical protein M1833_006026 [Piccolia ochrophora]
MPAIPNQLELPDLSSLPERARKTIEEQRKLYLLSLYGAKVQRIKFAGIADPYQHFEEIQSPQQPFFSSTDERPTEATGLSVNPESSQTLSFTSEEPPAANSPSSDEPVSPSALLASAPTSVSSEARGMLARHEDSQHHEAPSTFSWEQVHLPHHGLSDFSYLILAGIVAWILFASIFYCLYRKAKSERHSSHRRISR